MQLPIIESIEDKDALLDDKAINKSKEVTAQKVRMMIILRVWGLCMTGPDGELMGWLARFYLLSWIVAKGMSDL